MKAYIRKIVYELPLNIESNPPDSRLTKKTGIFHRHIAGSEECASDLALRAAEKLFAQGIDRSSIEYILFCTQSPDYILPTTACLIHHKLGLDSACGALDFNLGCSGYIYGLSLAKGLIESGQARHILLLTAETYSKYIHPNDASTKPLFGDAASATFIIGMDEEKDGIHGMILGTDGGGYRDLIVPAGGARQPFRTIDINREAGDTELNLSMNGAGIADFAMNVVPDTFKKVLEKCGLQKEHIDYFVFHQANQFMLEFLQKKCGLVNYPYWNHVEEYGNTVSNSIPIALVDLLAAKKSAKLHHTMLIGFGVGLSWGGCIVDLSLCMENSDKDCK